MYYNNLFVVFRNIYDIINYASVYCYYSSFFIYYWLFPTPVPLQNKIKQLSITKQQNEYVEKRTARFREWVARTSANANANANTNVVNRTDVGANANIEKIFYNEDKRPLKRMLLSVDNELDRKWKTRFLIETTPRGNIIMMYDVYKNTFSYYCDFSNVPHPILNACAMKFVMNFRCLDLFLDCAYYPEGYAGSPLWNVYEMNLLSGDGVGSGTDAVKKIDINAFVRPKSNVFASLKKYNPVPTPNGGGGVGSGGGGKNTEIVNAKNITNKFIFSGKITSHISFLQSAEVVIKKQMLFGGGGGLGGEEQAFFYTSKEKIGGRKNKNISWKDYKLLT